MKQLAFTSTQAPGYHVGFTGTQRGMTIEQKAVVRLWLETFRRNVVAHHGDCVGADADFHALLGPRRLGNIVTSVCERVVIHPPADDGRRAWCEHRKFPPIQHNVLPAKPYLVRNQDIVEAAHAMIATPGERTEQVRSGTWATIRMAKRAKCPIRVVFPDGTFTDF